MNRKQLSVIIPVYNVEQYLRQCLDSVEKQTYNNLDIILVDDGSTDSSGKICEEYAALDERIKVIHQNNSGMIGARATGIENAMGEYVIFMDSDDFIEKEAYENLMTLAVANDADMVTSGCYRYFDDSKMFKNVCSLVDPGKYDRKDIEEKIFPTLLWGEESNIWTIDASLCMKVVRRELLAEQYENIKGQTFFYGEDAAVIFPAILNMNCIYITHDCYYYHRVKGWPPKYVSAEEFPTKLYMLYQYLYGIFSKSEFHDILIRQLDMHYVRAATMMALKYDDVFTKRWNYVTTTVQWLFPYDRIPKGSRIVLYGAGKVGKQYFEQLGKLDYCSEILWVDKNFKELDEVSDPEKLQPNSYDYVLIAVKNPEAIEEIKQSLLEKGWKEESIIKPDFEKLAMPIT